MSERRVLIVPKTGLIVRDPITLRPLAAGGESKPLSTYWRRRVRSGDVVERVDPSTSACGREEQ
jgi:hypothetical protein